MRGIVYMLQSYFINIIVTFYYENFFFEWIKLKIKSKSIKEYIVASKVLIQSVDFNYLLNLKSQ